MLHRPVSLLAAAVLALTGCQTGNSRAPDASAVPHGKPKAPVKLAIESKKITATTFDVMLTATPTADVSLLELTLNGRRTMAGETTAGESRSVTARIELGNESGREIFGSAAMTQEGSRRNAATSIVVGTLPPAPEPKVQVVRLPDGSEAAEVR